MERQTRVQKYKNLRDEMKEEVAINRHIDNKVEEDDDFLAFMPKENKKDLNDTLIQPLSYETLDEDKDVKHAINEAKATIGKDQFNTRLDILSKIKKEDVVEESEQEEDVKKMSLLEKLASISPEEDVKELRRYEEDMSINDFMKSQKQEKEVFEEESEEEESRVVTVLNYIIITLIVVFVILIGFLIKHMFFG